MIDGNKLRELRIQKGVSQEKLGLLTNLNKRTIQRAEQGHAVSLETIAFIADALEVDPKTLRAPQLELFEATKDAKPLGQGEVVLVPVTKGSRLINSLRQAFKAHFEYQAEPTDSNLPLLEEFAEVINTAWVDPWQPPDAIWERAAATSDTEVLRLQAKANRLLPQLADAGIKVFVASYESWQQIPKFDMDEGFMSVRTRQPKEKVSNVILVVTDEDSTHLTRAPEDHEVFTLEKRAFSDDLDGEIPF